ncbi:MAG: RNA polymerase factor sigma-54 [Muribaculaceae bacterium]
MASKTGFEQTQIMEQTQRQVALPSTILVGQMLEKSYEEAMQYVNDEMDKNPALEQAATEPEHNKTDEPASFDGSDKDSDNIDYDPRNDYRDDDDTPAYLTRQGNQRGADDEVYVPEVVEEESLYDHLTEQLNQLELTPQQRLIGGYVIGNIDSNGYLTRSAYDICYDMLARESIDVSEEDVQTVIEIIKTLDPAGIAAANLRESLLIQLRGRIASDPISALAYKAVDRYIDDIGNRHFDRLRRALRIDDDTLAEVMHTIRSLNPYPGAGFTSDRTVQHAITVNPDFRVEYDEESDELEITSLNRLPELQVSESYKAISNTRLPRNIAKSEKGQQKLARNYVSRAEELITLLKIRQDTLLRVVRAIVLKQKDYFITLDEAQLRPLTLSDIAPIVGSDVSVISRATKGKYIETRAGCRPFKFFFTEGMVVKKGDSADDVEEVSTREIIKALKTLIDGEDKSKPLTDQRLTDLLNEMGYPIKRRTVAKYREERLNTPVARQRKEHIVKKE